MDNEAILAMLKANLEKLNSVNDAYLSQLIEAAKQEIGREGIVLEAAETADPETEETTVSYPMDDANLIVMYAAHLYRNRITTGDGYATAALYPQGMPYYLRLALNNRIFAQQMGSDS